MKYSDILEAHFKYGTTRKDIIKRYGYEEILDNVVLAPWWSHEIFREKVLKIEKVSDKVFNIYGDGFSFSYIEVGQVGAPVILDMVLALGVTKCKSILFIGSVGSLSSEIKIGDIVIPNGSICCDGASRYLNRSFKDEFFEVEYPTVELTKKLVELVQKFDVKYHHVLNCSVDSIFGQFVHIDEFLERGALTIEMETASLFKASALIGVNVSAIFVVSDSGLMNKSLFSGRSDEENKYRHYVKEEVIPEIVCRLFKG